MDLGIKGKTALITGSTEGIGYSTAKLLGQEGVIVYVNGRKEETVQATIERLKKEGVKDARPAAFNVATKTGADALFKALPKVDILVNNMGIYEIKPFEEISDEDWLRIFEYNVLSGIRLSRHYFPKMKENKWGRILFISSESGISTPADMIHYGTTKSAQLAVSRGLAEMTPGTGITVNSILPGPTYSKGVMQFVEDIAKSKGLTPQQVEDDFFKNVRPSSLIKRFETSDEVASLITYVCSVHAAAINGAALRVDGGVVKSMV